MALLSFKPSKVKISPAILDHKHILQALSVPFTIPEEVALSYVSGYFFKKLLSFHKKSGYKCDKCGNHGSKVTITTDSFEPNDIILYFRRYETDNATLYKCSHEFKLFVQKVSQITNFCFKNLPDFEGLVGLIQNSARHYVTDHPEFCSDEMRIKFLTFVARVFTCYKTKWLNDDLKKAKKRGKKKSKAQKKLDSKRNRAQKKLDKLSHK